MRSSAAGRARGGVTTSCASARRRASSPRWCRAPKIASSTIRNCSTARCIPIIDHPELGDCPYEGYPVKLSRTPAFVHGRAPTLAEHNQYVYGELLGMSDAEIAGLREREVI